MSYGIGKIIFPSSPVERLALFLTGLCPGGGASNIWSIAVDANVNLSITMTTISMIAAFGKLYYLTVFNTYNIKISQLMRLLAFTKLRV